FPERLSAFRSFHSGHLRKLGVGISPNGFVGMAYYFFTPERLFRVERHRKPGGGRPRALRKPPGRTLGSPARRVDFVFVQHLPHDRFAYAVRAVHVASFLWQFNRRILTSIP